MAFGDWYGQKDENNKAIPTKVPEHQDNLV